MEGASDSGTEGLTQRRDMVGQDVTEQTEW